MPPRYEPCKDGLASMGHLHPDWGGLSSCRTRPAGKERAAPKPGPWVFGLCRRRVAYQPSLSPTRKNRSSMPSRPVLRMRFRIMNVPEFTFQLFRRSKCGVFESWMAAPLLLISKLSPRQFGEWYGYLLDAEPILRPPTRRSSNSKASIKVVA